MENNLFSNFKAELIDSVGRKNLLTSRAKTSFYRTGIRVGSGDACAVVFPTDLLELWKILNICIKYETIIIIQAANTGLTGGSTPYGNDYGRDVVIVNTLKLDKLIFLESALQVIAFPGATLYQLEDKLSSFSRTPHSVIGSSCIGASIVGGVCNNSGGNLVNRGPAYTELSLYAQLNKQGKLELINHLDIDLGNSPEEIIKNLQAGNFDSDKLEISSKRASDVDYEKRVRDINSSTPSRFNADTRRLYEASGCAGKIAVFAVRLDTFAKPTKQQLFFVGTNNPDNFTVLRKKILTNFDKLPDMGEYMHRSYFDGADKYCKDTFLIIKYLGSSFLPILLLIKRRVDLICSKIFFLPDDISDKILQFFSNLMPDHLPKRIRSYRDKYQHYMLILASDSTIENVRRLLDEETNKSSSYKYFICTDLESKDALLHRYVAGSAPSRFKKLYPSKSGDVLPLDIALPRNCDSWYKILPEDILNQFAECFQMAHFFCMVFHWDFVVKNDVNTTELKSKILKILDEYGAKYPAEHNVGHLYKAEKSLEDFYKQLDPTNSFNAGIGKTSKNKFYN